MTRIAIIGNAGGGKSTLARFMEARLSLPLHPVDRLQWRPGWRAVPMEEFTVAHEELLSGDRWIIDGWGPLEAIAARFERADAVVLVDFPLWRHYWWAMKRQFRCIFRPRIDGPIGCPMIPMTWKLLKMIWAIDRDAMPRIREMVEAQRATKQVFHVRSLSQLRAFVALVSDMRQERATAG